MTAYERTGDVLAAIDATLDTPAHDALLVALDHAYSDGTVSDQAMRWTPVPPEGVTANGADPYDDPFTRSYVERQSWLLQMRDRPRPPARSLAELQDRKSVV